MSKRYAEENGFEDVLLLNEQKNIVESLVGTLYLLQGNQILTPGLESGCQDFTYRSAFNKWLNKKQTIYSLIENDVNPFELQKSEEVMILSLEKGFQCVSNYRKTTYPQRKTEDIFNAFSINFF
jgi:branched-chain amino acid aminotransferase